MEEYFFSEKNVSDLTKQLILNLELGQDQLNKDVVMKCKKIITNHMKDTYTKYGNNKPSNIGAKEYIGKMNNKSLKDCMQMFDIKKSQNGSSSSTEKRKSSNGKSSNGKSGQYGLAGLGDNSF